MDVDVTDTDPEYDVHSRIRRNESLVYGMSTHVHATF